MASEVVTTSKWQSTVAFVRDSYHEIRTRTTWPDMAQVRQASVAIIIFVLAIGLVISVLDFILNFVLVQFLPSVLS